MERPGERGTWGGLGRGNHQSDVYVYMCIFVYMYICIYAYMHICIYVYMYMCICKHRRRGWARLSMKTVGFENPFSELSCACETIVAALLARGKSNFTGVHKTHCSGRARLCIKSIGFEISF